MKVIDEIRSIFLTVLILAVSGCSRDPEVITTAHFNLGFENMQEQRALAGEGIDVFFYFTKIVNEEYDIDSVKVAFEVLTGGGALDLSESYIASGEIATAVWTLGHESFRQVLRATVWDLSGRMISHRDLVAYGFRENQWDKVTGTPEVQIIDMVADTVNDVTYMTTFSKLYRQGERYFIWDEVSAPVFQHPDYPRTVEIDRNGVIYTSTSGGNIIRSTDHGFSWQPCTKPWPDIDSYIQQYVSNDNRLWVYTAGRLLRYSDDMGFTWHDAGPSVTTGGIGDIFRLADGTLVSHGLHCCSLALSGDDGQTWTPLATPDFSHKLYVSEDEDFFVLSSQGTGEVIFRSTDRGASFTFVHSVGVSFRSSYDNIFTHWGDNYFIAVPGFGIMKSDDLTEFENHWLFSDLRTLYIDHNGVLMVKDKDFGSVYYLNNPG